MADIYRIELERDGLHRNLGGGFPKGSIVLLEGEHGSGKSAVCQRLLYGFLKNNNTVTLVSTEFTTKGFIAQMKSLNYNVVDYMLAKSFLFIPVYPIVGQSRNREDFLGRLLTAEALFERDIIIIDTLSSLVKYDIDVERTLETIAFFKKLAGRNKTIIITMDKNDMSDELMERFRSDSDVFLEIRKTIIEGSTTRSIVVKRFTGCTEPIIEVTGFRMESKVGFIIDITTIA